MNLSSLPTDQNHTSAGVEPSPPRVTAGAARAQKPPALRGRFAYDPRRAGLDPEAGIATAEFSIVTLAAVGFAGLLVVILSSGDVKGLLMGMIKAALGN